MATSSDRQISVESARELQKNWIENQGRAIENGMGLQDARDFSFGLEELQEFINLVRDQSKEQGVSDPGIRIFFGAYGEEEEKRATVFLQATGVMNYAGQSDADQEGDEVQNNYQILPLNTVKGGFPPTDY